MITESGDSGKAKDASEQPIDRLAPKVSQTVWARLKAHKVLEWTLAYAAAAYTLLHLVEMVGNAFDWPHFVARIVTLLLAIGVPIAGTLAWYQGHRAQHRVSGPELTIITVLLVIAGSAMWLVGRPSHERAPLQRVAVAPAVIASAPVAEGPPPEMSIAVLPFLDMSEKHDQEYFSDGLSEELIDLLTQVPDLRVPARTSSFFFKGKSEDIATIAQKLRVAHVLEGSVRKAANTIRVTAQLIRADNGYHLWSETYDRDLKDVFKVQDEIASAVVSALELKLAPRQQVPNAHRTSNAEAYNQYLLGRQFYERGDTDSLQRAVEAYRKAVQLDPRYASAYAELARAEFFVADQAGDAVGLQQAFSAADTAVELAPEAADGYAARGFLRYVARWDWAGAQADLGRALVLEPSNSTVQLQFGGLLSCLGRLPEAIAAMRKAIALDPLSASTWNTLSRRLIAARQFENAHEAIRRALEIQPESPFALNGLGTLLLVEGNAAEALAEFRQIRPIGERGVVLGLTGIAMAEHTLGHRQESQHALNRVIAEHAHASAYQIAQTYAWWGEKDNAFQWLERAYQQRDGGVSSIKIDLMLASLRGDPRYRAFLNKMDLPE